MLFRSSTVVDVTGDSVVILRQGAVAEASLEACLVSNDLPGVGR